MRNTIIGIMIVLLSGCANYKMAKNNDSLLNLEMGITKQQVVKVMGKPDLNEAYQSLHGQSVVIYFYYTQRKRSDGNITKDETTPIVFENGKLIGWGDEFYKTKMQIDVNINNN